jgi:hypothetical protein
MALRKPLVLTSGVVQNLQAGDRLNGLWVFQGAWSGATAYVTNDVVTLGGSAYVCILANTNQTPPNATYWNVLVAKGDAGTTGADGISFGGRLTLQSNVPVSIGNQVNASTLYYTPYFHGYIFLKISGSWQRKAFTQFSAALPNPGFTPAPYDVFLYDNSGTVAMEFVKWTDSGTRATALTADSDTGLLVKSGDATRVYVGSLYIAVGGASNDSEIQRWLFNWFNPVERHFRLDAGDLAGGGDWTAVNLTSYRVANSTAVPTMSVMFGKLGGMFDAHIKMRCVNSAAGSATVGIGINSTSPGGGIAYNGVNLTTLELEVQAYVRGNVLSLGYNEINWVEKGSASNTVTFRESDGSMFGFLTM